ncbi:Lar family restriction alleviation protein [Burkholderia ambifaria]|uniref:Lar family restriction alleviation protein n=1 Tax=Burkholderia ambifaria TaxID=152480 RepID=UPI001E5468BB|nr:Lar family restriction alleviation protein [Burkholderia ambifaria]UEP23148.1 Lar family restriction alleviation protein [Burkholderia ambifaria]
MSKDDLGQTEPPLPGRDRSHNVTERELKPCPFCGGRAAIQQGGFTKYVMCLKCEVMGPNLASDVELIDAWNRRTTPDREAWISVDERLPEAHTFWLVCAETDEGPVIQSMYFDGKNWIHEGEPTFCHSYMLEPTHWMPLPTAPNGDAE